MSRTGEDNKDIARDLIVLKMIRFQNLTNNQ